MAVRTLEYPLPELDCEDCAAELHKRLMDEPGVRTITVEAQAKVVKVEVDEEDYAAAALRTRVKSLLDGEAQAMVHHRSRSGLPPGGGEAAAKPSSDAGATAPVPKKGAAGLPALAVLPTGAVGRAPEAAAHPAGDGSGHEGHDHDHSHDDGHGHSHDHGAELKEIAQTNRKRLFAVVVVGTIVALVEVVVGLAANSLALISDATHAATDVAAVALALLAVTWALKAASRTKTFGYQRAEVVAAFVNALALWAISIYFIYEAWHRLLDPPEVKGLLVMLMGGATLVANAGMAWTLHRGSSHSLNVKAAYAHVLSDLLGSAAALLAGILIYWKGWLWADPLLTFLISVLILRTAWILSRDTLHILMQGAPAHAEPLKVAQAIQQVPGVRDVHDLHVWTLTSGMDSVSAHIVLAERPSDDRVVHAIHATLKSTFKIDHVTVQVEDPTCPCTGIRHQWHAA